MKRLSFLCIAVFSLFLVWSSSAFAITIIIGPDAIVRSSEVSTVVTDNQDGTYTYNYTVINTSPGPQPIFDGETLYEVWPLIVDYEVPLNAPSDVWDIVSPATWDHEFISAAEYITRYGEANPFGSAYILHWFDTDPPPGTNPGKVISPDGYAAWFDATFGFIPDVYEPSTDGFIFTSSLAPIDGPYLTSWHDDFRNIGDPPLPGGSFVSGGRTLPFSSSHPIPEPATMLLFGSGLIGLAGFKRKLSN